MENETKISRQLSDLSDQMCTMIINQNTVATELGDIKSKLATQPAPVQECPKDYATKADVAAAREKICNQVLSSRPQLPPTTLPAHLSEMDSQILNMSWADVKILSKRVRWLLRMLIISPFILFVLLSLVQGIYYWNSSVYWGNRAYKAAVKLGHPDSGRYYDTVQKTFPDTTVAFTRKKVKELERQFKNELH